MTKKPLFELGTIVATPGALELKEKGVNLAALLMRHVIGDWGNVSKKDAVENEMSLMSNFRILSSYETPFGNVWIITEADRSATTFLLPDEY